MYSVGRESSYWRLMGSSYRVGLNSEWRLGGAGEKIKFEKVAIESVQCSIFH